MTQRSFLPKAALILPKPKPCRQLTRAPHTVSQEPWNRPHIVLRLGTSETIASHSVEMRGFTHWSPSECQPLSLYKGLSGRQEMLEDTRGLESCLQEASGALELGCLRQSWGQFWAKRLGGDCSKISIKGWRQIIRPVPAWPWWRKAGKASGASLEVCEPSVSFFCPLFQPCSWPPGSDPRGC